MAVLTQLAIAKAKPRGRRFELKDGAGGVPGFAVRVGETGVKSYVVRYRVDGRQRRVTIGLVSVLFLAEARARARALVDQAKQGVDPAAAKAERRVQQRSTVSAIVEEYAERHLRRNLKSAAWIERLLRRTVVADWGGRPMRSITKADVIRLVDGLADRGAGVMANRTLQLVGRFFAWAVKRSIIETSPAAGIALPHKEQSRDRVLDDHELAAIWTTAERLDWPWAQYIKLLVLLGQRRAEIAALRWQDLDLTACVWRMPAAQTKMGRARTLPLPGAAVDLLAALPRIENAGGYVFPGRGSAPICAFSGMKQDLDCLSGIKDWVLHDVRRTFATGQQRLGTRIEVTEQLLGHVSGSRAGVIGVYQRHDFAAEQRVALERWAEHIDRIVAGGEAKVVQFHGGAARCATGGS